MHCTTGKWSLRVGAGALLLLVAYGLFTACGTSRKPFSGGRGTLRLVEVFQPEMIQNAARGVAPIEAIEWRFEGTAQSATGPWQAGAGVQGLRVEGGRLRGSTTDPVPVIWGRCTPRGEPTDTVHTLEVRMSASKGANVYFSFHGGGPPDTERARSYWNSAPEHLQLPIVADGEMRTYTVAPRGTVFMSNVSSVLLSPSDASGADFSIESVRVISQHAHLASLASGVGWHAVRGIWRESILARTSEQIRFELALPRRPHLDLSVAAMAGVPVTFRVVVETNGKRATVAELCVTETEHWQALPADLSTYANREVVLSLELEAQTQGAVCLWGAPAIRERYEPKPNIPQGVIVVLADTLRVDHLAFHGYERETAPAVATLAKRGALFSDCTTQATWTQPAMASIVTSLYPESHRVVGMGDQMAEEAETLAECFRSAGYATVGYSSVKFTGRFTNFQQGFEVLHEAESLPSERPSKSATYYVARLLPWIAEHKEDRFFVFLHLFDPHDPYEPRSPFDTWWTQAERAELHREKAKQVRPHIADPALQQIGLPTAAELELAGIDPQGFVEHERDWYDGSILGMDYELQKLMKGLQEQGLLDRVLVLFTSDHGEEFLDHGRMWHGQSVYGELTRVPLVLFGAGVPKSGLVIDEPVRSIDIMPTLLELFDLRAPAHLQGQSMLPLLRRAAGMSVAAEAWERRPIVSQKASLADERSSPPPRKAGMVAISDGRYKLIHNDPREDGRPEWELYDRSTDPLDQHDLAQQQPEEVERLKGLLEQWRRQVGQVQLQAGKAESFDAESLRDIRALGYSK